MRFKSQRLKLLETIQRVSAQSDGRGAGVFLTCSGRPRQVSDLQPNWTLRGGNITGLRVQTVKTCGVILSAPPSGKDKLNISP